MNGYLVDANIPSELTRRQPDVRVADFIRKVGEENLFAAHPGIRKDYAGPGIALLNPRNLREPLRS